ncbi:MAG: hypothetical protein AAGE01_17980 [Pseudomonadota bacterium]
MKQAFESRSLRCVVSTAWFAMALVAGPACGQPSASLLDIRDLSFEGAVRLPANEFNGSSMNYSEGPLEYDPASNSILIVGHGHHQQLAEFVLPPPVRSDVLAELNMATPPIQGFEGVLGRMTGGNPQGLNRIGGLRLLDTADGRRLLVNAYEYYDAPGDNTHTSLLLDDPGAISASSVIGPKRFDGGAGHTSGWISPVPEAWQNALGGDHITGQSSGIPIIGRTSVGPSAFAFDASSLADESETIETVRLLDFSLADPLHPDLSNDSRGNDLWTHLSRAVFGMVVPGTRTYLTIGYSGGHESGVCYKCTQDNGNLCGGYCPRIASDQSNYYWLWDLNDLIDARNGAVEPHQIRPYGSGEFQTPFSDHLIGGGSYDPASGLLYVSVPGADREQGRYANPPVILAFSISTVIFRDSFE